MSSMKLALSCIAVGGLCVLGGCGDDDGGTVDATVSSADASTSDGAVGADATPVDAPIAVDAAAVDAGSGPGTITIVSAELTGLVGKVLLVSASQGAGRLAGTCDQITMSPQTITSVMKTPQAMNPCTLGAEITLDPGTYDITAGLYTPGQMTPEQCASTTATVAGNITVNLPALGACN